MSEEFSKPSDILRLSQKIENVFSEASRERQKEQKRVDEMNERLTKKVEDLENLVITELSHYDNLFLTYDQKVKAYVKKVNLELKNLRQEKYNLERKLETSVKGDERRLDEIYLLKNEVDSLVEELMTEKKERALREKDLLIFLTKNFENIEKTQKVF